MARELHHGLDLNGNPIVGLPATPTAADEAASKAYVDSKAAGGGSLPANIVAESVSAMPADFQVALPDPPVAGRVLGYEVMAYNPFLGVGVGFESVGGEMQLASTEGPVPRLNVGAPTGDHNAATKKYVDDAVAAGGGGGGVTDHGALTGLADDDHPQYVKKAGDTMTGGLNAPDIGANTVSVYVAPTLDAHATPKSYVDTADAAKVTGPASATDKAIARFSGTTGKLLSNATNSPTIQDDGKLLVNAMQGAPLMVYNSSGEPHFRSSGSGISLFSATTIVDVNARAVLGIANATIVPAADVAGAAQLFVEGGVLKARYADAAGNGAIPRVIVGGTKPTAPAVGTIWVPAG